mgnify:CR=1 FL=1
MNDNRWVNLRLEDAMPEGRIAAGSWTRGDKDKNNMASAKTRIGCNSCRSASLQTPSLCGHNKAGGLKAPSFVFRFQSLRHPELVSGSHSEPLIDLSPRTDAETSSAWQFICTLIVNKPNNKPEAWKPPAIYFPVFQTFSMINVE